jgi:hypothetical protein
MAILEEANLLAERARHAKHRTHHVGTKLNEGELHEFEALAERRKQSPSELIRGLVLGEIERDKQPAPELRPSVELEEITRQALSIGGEIPSAPASLKALRCAPMNAQKTRGLDRRLRCGWVLVMRRMSSSHVSKNT